jgi:hypothetical protein
VTVTELSNPQLIEEMRWQLRKIEERKAENARVLAGIAASGGLTTVTSSDRTVTVAVAPGGVIGEVRLADEAMRSTAAALSAVITTTIRDALSSSTDKPPAAPAPAGPPPAPVRQPQRRPTPAERDHDEPIDTVFDL